MTSWMETQLVCVSHTIVALCRHIYIYMYIPYCVEFASCSPCVCVHSLWFVSYLMAVCAQRTVLF